MVDESELPTSPSERAVLMESLLTERATVFTDDFDALLSLQSEFRWTRNLLVTLIFGPKLTPARQNYLLPFRDPRRNWTSHRR